MLASDVCYRTLVCGGACLGHGYMWAHHEGFTINSHGWMDITTNLVITIGSHVRIRHDAR